MSKYLSGGVLQELIKMRDVIFAEQRKAWTQYGVDLLSTDGLSSLQIYEVVSQYDKDFNINFARNGEDGQSNGVMIEAKVSKVNKASAKSSFAFHAMGDIFHERYIFAVRDNSSLNLIRLYDIDKPNNVEKVKAELLSEREKYIAKGFRKYDVIRIQEKFILENLNFDSMVVLNDCIVYKDVIY